METIQISKSKRIILSEDALTYIQEDVISEHLKSQTFLFENLDEVKFQDRSINWFWSVLNWITSAMDEEEPHVFGKENEIQIVLRDKTVISIRTGQLSLKEIKQLAKKINHKISPVSK
jgi:hypothetical protein